jgi:hypothetical protein
MASNNGLLIEEITLKNHQRSTLLSISERISTEATAAGSSPEESITPYQGNDIFLSKKLKQSLSLLRDTDFQALFSSLLNEYSNTEDGSIQPTASSLQKQEDSQTKVQSINEEQNLGMTMWDKFSQVLNLGDAWADEDGKGEWTFATSTRVSVRFQTLDDMDELEGTLDVFEEASEDEKEGLKDSLNQEGYVSYFQYTVTTPSGEEYYFNQLTGGGGEPVVEDFYCEEDQRPEINDALDAVLDIGSSPTNSSTSYDENSDNDLPMLVRIKPTEKKSVCYRTLLTRDGDVLEVTEWYRWGQGFIKEDEWSDTYAEREKISVDPTCGPGCELDDQISILVLLNSQRNEEIEQEWLDGNVENFLQDGWDVEEEEVIISGPYNIDRIENSF